MRSLSFDVQFTLRPLPCAGIQTSSIPVFSQISISLLQSDANIIDISTKLRDAGTNIL